MTEHTPSRPLSLATALPDPTATVAVTRGLEALADGIRHRYPGAVVTTLKRDHPRGGNPEGDLKEGQRDTPTQLIRSHS